MRHPLTALLITASLALAACDSDAESLPIDEQCQLGCENMVRCYDAGYDDSDLEEIAGEGLTACVQWCIDIHPQVPADEWNTKSACMQRTTICAELDDVCDIF